MFVWFLVVLIWYLICWYVRFLTVCLITVCRHSDINSAGGTSLLQLLVMFSPFPQGLSMLYHAREEFFLKKFYLSNCIHNKRIHASPDLFWTEESQPGLSADLKDERQSPQLRLQSKQLCLRCHWPRVLGSAVLPWDMVDANFNKDRGRKQCDYANSWSVLGELSWLNCLLCWRLKQT